MKQRIVTLALLLHVGMLATAQLPQHEFSIYGNIGLSTLSYSGSEIGSNSIGGNFGLGYGLNFNKHWALLTGVEVATYGAQGQMSVFNYKYDYYDSEYASGKTLLTFNADGENYTEKQRTISINIPLMARFRYPTSHSVGFYAAAGLKLFIPITTKYNGSMGTLTTWGFSEATWQEQRNQPEYGFSTYEDWESKGSVDLKLGAMAALEAGAEWGFKNYDRRLYTGLYFDYGFTDLNKKSNQASVVVYDANNQSLASNSMVNASSNKCNNWAAGITVRYTFGWGKNVDDTYMPPVDEEALARDSMRRADSIRVANALAEQLRAEKEAEEAKAAALLAQQQAEEAKKAAEAERAAYLKQASERRKKYNTVMNVKEGNSSGYAFNSAALTPKQQRTLDECARRLRANEGATINIIGHTDNIGSEEVNIFVGQERADVAKDYLVEKGVMPQSITTDSKGKSEPLVPNTSAYNRRKNRRLEIKITIPQKVLVDENGNNIEGENSNKSENFIMSEGE